MNDSRVVVLDSRAEKADQGRVLASAANTKRGEDEILTKRPTERGNLSHGRRKSVP